MENTMCRKSEISSSFNHDSHKQGLCSLVDIFSNTRSECVGFRLLQVELAL